MDPSVAFATLVERVLIPAKAERFAALAGTEKGHKAILKGLYHDFEAAIRPAAIVQGSYERVWDQPCFLFAERHGFGVEYATVREAYEEVASFDGWLIVLQDGSAGIYRPEGRWDAEKLLARYNASP